MALPKETTILKVYIPKTLRDEFKEICEADGVAMSDRLEQFILRMVEKRASKS
jgi:hypothetical protein